MLRQADFGIEKFEYDGNDILSIKMALENMLEQRLKYVFDTSFLVEEASDYDEVEDISNNISSCAYDTLQEVDDLVSDYIKNWLEKKEDNLFRKGI